MAKHKIPVTPAIRALRQARIDHRLLPYDYVSGGGARHAADALELPRHQVVKTLVFASAPGVYLIVLMHGDREVSTKNLARQLDVKRISPCDPKTAEKLTGYQVGGISPFGTRQRLPVYAEADILGMDRIFINAGKRGLLMEIAPAALTALLGAVAVQAAVY